MKKSVRFFGLIIIVFGFYFYFIPFVNQTRSALINFKFFEVELFFSFSNSLIYIICGIGIFKLNKIARKLWLIYSVCVIIINLPFVVASMQQLVNGAYNTIPLPFYYWVKNYGSLLLLILSLIFLNLSKAKKALAEK